MKTQYRLSLTTDNTLRVLQRIATMFSRHRINIDQLTVCETICEGVSEFNIIIQTEPQFIHTLVKQLKRVIEVHEIKSHEIKSHEIKACGVE